MKKKLILREGFWYSKSESHLPKAIARKNTWKGQKSFLKKLLVVQEKAQAKHSKGWSDCRCCDRRNGSVEFVLVKFGLTFVWPSGYVHYIADHNIRPSLAFQEFIEAAHKDTV